MTKKKEYVTMERFERHVESRRHNFMGDNARTMMGILTIFAVIMSFAIGYAFLSFRVMNPCEAGLMAWSEKVTVNETYAQFIPDRTEEIQVPVMGNMNCTLYGLNNEKSATLICNHIETTTSCPSNIQILVTP